MTPQALTGLAALLMDLRDWLAEIDPGSLDAGTVDYVIDVVAVRRKALVEELAR